MPDDVEGGCWPGPADLHCLDVFSRSGKIAQAFTRREFRSSQFDIATSVEEDITTEKGFATLILKGLRLLPNGFVMLAPPCSMFTFFSSSQHGRSWWGAWGNPMDPSTKLANLIAVNTVIFMMVIKRARRAQMLLEQPRGSWLLKLPPVLELIAEFHLQRISAHLIFWGHVLEKPTTLVGDLEGMDQLQRTMTKDARRKFQKRRKKVLWLTPDHPNHANAHHGMYVKDSKGKVHGTTLLAKSAIYPYRFCNDIARLWMQSWNPQ
ncbi:unnamed protein product [Durusdinium trenchii]|uniref:Uncharacterized protein n=1 Tax=Durusdinium trenchii TaxID=1381693 RepID=A0ABP0N8A6_9DINO